MVVELTRSHLNCGLVHTQDQSKREILKTRILPTMATNRTLQRVVTKYQLMLSEITSREADSEEEDESDSVDDSEA